MGARYFSMFQYGKETTRGSAVAATKKMLCRVPAVGNDRKPEYPREDVGIRARAVRSVVHQYLYNNTLSSEHGYFQMLPALFGCGLKGGVTAAEQTTGEGDYLWAFTPVLTFGNYNTPDSLTVELGDDTQAFEAEHVMFERIRISGKVSQGMEVSPVSIEADFFGKQLTPTTFTGSLAIPTAEPINAKLSRFYLDTAWAGIGGTEKANILRSFDIEILTGISPKFAGSGSKTFNGYLEDIIDFSANFEFEGGSDADAMFDAQQAQTFQAIRLMIEGGAIGSGDNHSLSIDMGGTWESVVPLASEDKSLNIHSATFGNHYDATGAKLLQVNVTTDINAY